MRVRFGVDEAGKGPVLGSMFAAAIAVTDEGVLPDGLVDSKRLSPASREEFAERLREEERVTIAVSEITPATIDDPATDMNTLTVEAHARALDAVVADLVVVGPADVKGIVDAGDVDETRFARRVTDRLSGDVALVAEHGADDRHPLVSAASVIAKVERDAHVARLCDEYGPVGSGYPGDPNTRRFLADFVGEHGRLPDCARSSWRTCDDVLAAAEQSSLVEF